MLRWSGLVMGLGMLAVLAMAGTRALPGATRMVSAQESVWVSMIDNIFSPDVIVITAGTTVIWTNDESDPTNAHDVVLVNGLFASAVVYPGDFVSFTFTTPGEYTYICTFHEGMVGVVIVR